MEVRDLTVDPHVIPKYEIEKVHISKSGRGVATVAIDGIPGKFHVPLATGDEERQLAHLDLSVEYIKREHARGPKPVVDLEAKGNELKQKLNEKLAKRS